MSRTLHAEIKVTNFAIRQFYFFSFPASAALRWWPNWSSMLESLNKVGTTTTKTNLVAALPSKAYNYCGNTTLNLVCIDDNLFNDEGGNLGTFLNDFFGSDESFQVDRF